MTDIDKLEFRKVSLIRTITVFAGFASTCLITGYWGGKIYTLLEAKLTTISELKVSDERHSTEISTLKQDVRELQLLRKYDRKELVTNP